MHQPNDTLTAGFVGMASTMVADAAGLIDVKTAVSSVVVGFAGALGGLAAKFIFGVIIKKFNKQSKNK